MRRRSIVVLAVVLLATAALPGFTADTWYITTVAGTGKAGYSGDGGPATKAMFDWREGWGFWATSTGILYICDSSNNRIRKIDASGIVTTVAGNGTRGFSGDGGPATEARLNRPISVIVDCDENIYIIDHGNRRLRKVDRSGIITTVAGNGKIGDSGDGGLATEASLDTSWMNIAIDRAGNIYLGSTVWSGETPVSSRIRKIDPSGTISAFAGTGGVGSSGDGGPAAAATFNWVNDIYCGPKGDLYVTETSTRRIRKIDTNGIISTAAGGGVVTNDGVRATDANLAQVGGLSVDVGRNIYFQDGSRIRAVDTAGIITTIAGNAKPGYSGDGGPATDATLRDPCPRIAADGNIYVADFGNLVIRKLYRP